MTVQQEAREFSLVSDDVTPGNAEIRGSRGKPQSSLKHIEDPLPSGIGQRADAAIDLKPRTVMAGNIYEHEYCNIVRTQSNEKGRAPNSKVNRIASEISLRLEQAQPRTGAQRGTKSEFMSEPSAFETEKSNLLEQIRSLRETEERQNIELGKMARLLYLSELGRKTAIEETQKLDQDLRTTKDEQRALLKTVNAYELRKESLRQEIKKEASSTILIVEMKAHIENLKYEIIALRSSTSWRITAPARAVTGRLRRLVKNA